MFYMTNSTLQAVRDGKDDIVIVKEWLRRYKEMRKYEGDKNIPHPFNRKDKEESLTVLHYAARFNKYNILTYFLTEALGL